MTDDLIRRPELVEIDFYGDKLLALRNERGAWLALRRACERVGVDLQGQLAKLRRKPWAVVENISTTGSDGKTYTMSMLHVRAVPAWLASIELEKVDESIRQRLSLYQIECADVLAAHFGLSDAPAPVSSAAIDFSDPRVIAGVLQAQIEKVALLQADIAKKDEEIVAISADLAAANVLVEEASDAIACVEKIVAKGNEYSIRMAASILQQKESRLREFLLDNHICHKTFVTSDRKVMVANAQYRPQYFRTRQVPIPRSNGEIDYVPQCVVTEDGIRWLAKKLKVVPDFGLGQPERPN